MQTYPNWHGAILMLGLDDVFNSWYFITLMALLSLNLTLCSLIRIRRVVKASQNAPAHQKSAFRGCQFPKNSCCPLGRQLFFRAGVKKVKTDRNVEQITKNRKQKLCKPTKSAALPFLDLIEKWFHGTILMEIVGMLPVMWA